MNEESKQEGKEWKIFGFSAEITKQINLKLMEDRYSYWFHYRSVPWYRKRRIKGLKPQELIETALRDLNLNSVVSQKEVTQHTSYYWIIEPKIKS